jgi:hypothetical protein
MPTTSGLPCAAARRHHRVWCPTVFLFVLGLLAAPSAFSADAPGPLPPGQQPANPASGSATNEIVANTPYAIGARRNGVSRCIPRINQVTEFLVGSFNHSGQVINDVTGDVNQRLVSAVIEIASPDSLAFASATFAPAANSGLCSATYDLVTYWPLECSKVAETSFKTFKPSRLLYRNIQTMESGAYGRVFLMPAGPKGCVSIKKEWLF